MMKERSVLLYNLYPKRNWKEVTEIVLGNIKHHEGIIINITLDKFDRFVKKHRYVEWYLRRKYDKILTITYSINNPLLGEVVGFDLMREQIDYDYYQIATYTHSKGVTKPRNSNVIDWIRLMSYFVVEKHDMCLKSFEEEYDVYGALLKQYDFNSVRKYTYKYCDFWYAGTFVSVDLRKVKMKFMTTPSIDNYYGVEAFFGNITSFDRAYNVHDIPYNLYQNSYSPDNYILK